MADLAELNTAYNQTWDDMPFTNLLNVEAIILSLQGNVAAITMFLTNQITPLLITPPPAIDTGDDDADSLQASPSPRPVIHIRVSEEGGTCGPFGIRATDRLPRLWAPTPHHTGHHGAVVTTRDSIRYLIDSSFRQVIELPDSGYVYLGADGTVRHQTHPPRIPYKYSAVVRVSGNDLYYTDKRSVTEDEISEVVRAELIKRPILALTRGSANLVLPIRSREKGRNRFFVNISVNMAILVFKALGVCANLEFHLQDSSGQPSWEGYANAIEYLYTLHLEYPSQVRRGILCRMSRILVTRMRVGVDDRATIPMLLLESLLGEKVIEMCGIYSTPDYLHP